MDLLALDASDGLALEGIECKGILLGHLCWEGRLAERYIGVVGRQRNLYTRVCDEKEPHASCRQKKK